MLLTLAQANPWLTRSGASSIATVVEERISGYGAPLRSGAAPIEGRSPFHSAGRTAGYQTVIATWRSPRPGSFVVRVRRLTW